MTTDEPRTIEMCAIGEMLGKAVRSLNAHGPKALAALLIGMIAAHEVCAAVRLPALLGNGMVLQRDARVTLRGWADPGEAVRIEFQGEIARTRADRNGRWSATVGPHPAGGPHEMTVSGKNRLVLRDILIGDLDPESNAPATLYWFRQTHNADGTVEFIPYLIGDDSGAGTQIAVKDVNRDGRPDVAVSNKNGAFVSTKNASMSRRSLPGSSSLQTDPPPGLSR